MRSVQVKQKMQFWIGEKNFGSGELTGCDLWQFTRTSSCQEWNGSNMLIEIITESNTNRIFLGNILQSNSF